MLNDWIQISTLVVAIIAAGASVWAAIATYGAAKAARDSADISAKQFKIQIDEQEKIERPRLVPLNHKISRIALHALDDWVDSENDSKKKLNGKEGFSEFTIPIINTGHSFALDVRYCFEIEGGIDAIRHLSYEKTFISEPNIIEEYKEQGFFTFIMGEETEHITSPGKVNNFFYAEVIPKYSYISIIQSDVTSHISIPSYFVVLSNIFLMNFFVKREAEMLRPILRLTIEYKDQYNNQHSDIYRMSLSDKHISAKGSAIETWIDFELINSNDK